MIHWKGYISPVETTTTKGNSDRESYRQRIYQVNPLAKSSNRKKTKREKTIPEAGDFSGCKIPFCPHLPYQSLQQTYKTHSSF